ncbi:MAG: flavodoxin domain-containing protein [Lagierella massiliensis]|nr:flavodoxin domain-containing protein [Lagierella massiliensis]
MKSLIVYGSKYGSSKKYAKKLSKKLNVDLVDFRNLKLDNDMDILIYVGALYAGTVVGLSKTLNLYKENNLKKVLIITVGIADPKSVENSKNIKEKVYRQTPEKLHRTVEVFNLMGILNYSKLSFKHKIMMKFLYYSLKKTPIEKQNEETKRFLSTYNKEVNFEDFNTLEPIVKRYLQIIKGDELLKG